MDTFHATTIIAIKKDGKTAIAGDGQVTLGSTIVKSTANKIRKLYNKTVISGFAGAAADAFSLFDKFENKLEEHHGNLKRASVELAKDWRTDKVLRKLEAMLIVADKDNILIVSGNGDILEPDNHIAAIGSGGNFAYSAAKALMENSELSAKEIAEKSLKIASDICIYTNSNIKIEEI